MWILGMIAAAVATSLIVMLIKGGITLVGEVVIIVGKAVFQAIGLVLSGVIWALTGIAVGTILAVKFIYRKITTKKTDVSDDDDFDWMRDARLRDE